MIAFALWTAAAVSQRLRAASERLEVECLDSLSRLASSLCHAELKSIENIMVTKVTSTEIEMQVVSCDEETCVSIFVPLLLPEACDDEETFEECVVANVKTLDSRVAVEHEVPEKLVSAKYTVLCAEEEKPKWWVDAVDGEMKRACADTRDILNGEFVSEVVRLAQKLAGRAVLSARIVRLGPAGIMMSARTDDDRPTTLDLEFPAVCEDAKSLQRTILGTVASSNME